MDKEHHTAMNLSSISTWMQHECQTTRDGKRTCPTGKHRQRKGNPGESRKIEIKDSNGSEREKIYDQHFTNK